MNDTFPVLYILMRNDLASMNPGKAMAQASHASNAFVKHLHDFGNDEALTPSSIIENDAEKIMGMADTWQKETEQGFGTVLVLSVNEHQMRFSVDAARRYGMVADVIHDPTYPILVNRDFTDFLGGTVATLPNIPGLNVYEGFVTVPMDTCAYVFTDKNDPTTRMILGGYPLYP